MRDSNFLLENVLLHCALFIASLKFSIKKRGVLASLYERKVITSSPTESNMNLAVAVFFQKQTQNNIPMCHHQFLLSHLYMYLILPRLSYLA